VVGTKQFRTVMVYGWHALNINMNY